jgi:hypothetical protein
MMNKHQSIMLAISLIFLTTLACAIPGQEAAPVPTPTVDPAQLNAIVAETVAAVLQETALAPTVTPVVTETSQPSPTPTSTPVEQSSLTSQSDGTVLFVDEKAGFTLIIPPGWLPVRIDQIEYYDAFSLPQAADPGVQTALMDINDLDPNIFRLFIFDLQDGHVQNGFVNNINVLWSLDSTLILETEEDIQKTAEELPSVVPGLTVTSTTVSETISGIPVGIILSEIKSQTSDGVELALFQKQVFLNLEEGSLTITFTTGQGIRDATLPFFDMIIESIELGE